MAVPLPPVSEPPVVSGFPGGPDDLRRLRAGDRDAFDRFFDAWFPRVLGWAHKQRSSNAEARDLTEAVLERAVGALGLASEASDFARFMLTVARFELDLRQP